MNRARLLTLLASILSLALVADLRAQDPHVYEFLRLDASARAGGMGGTFLTVTNDPNSIFYNPAALNTIDSSQVAFSYMKHLLDINNGSAAFATELEDIGKVGVGVSYMNYGAFDRTDKMGRDLGDFGASDLAFVVGWATSLGENFSAGVNGKMIFSGIDEASSTALALDGGLLYSDTSNRIRVGLSLMNLGAQVSEYGAEKETLPIDLKLGISHELRGLPLLIALNFHRLLDETPDFIDRFTSFSIGGEFRISQPLRLRLGYNNRLREDLAFGQSKDLAGFSAGLGVVVKDYRFDYAFRSLARLGALHQISINAAF